MSSDYQIDIVEATKEYFISRNRALTYRSKVRALNDINVRVKRGEILGLIGPNGAGKTTLLRAIGGTCPLDYGYIETRGDVRAVLSLTQSFLPHLSGRDNLTMYGSVLGLLQREIKQHLDYMIEFSELGAVIDEPVRQYSSGMKARLAFSIVTAGQPDILLLDEILAVGDASFVHKSNQRLRNLAKNGTTIVVASHDLNMIADCSDRLLLLRRGRQVALGEPPKIIARYYRMLKQKPRLQIKALH